MPSPTKSSSTTRQQGQQAESLAQHHLEQRGLRFITRNYRCKAGEIDLIMADRDSIVFIEVRLRNNPRFGSGAESVDQRKQRKLTATALHYLQRHPDQAKRPARFDVVAISTQQNQADIQWIENAF